MRADAEANRERVLDAAAEVFVEHGIEAPFNLIAERAGVGKGTLYRHFIDREALMQGLADRLQRRYAEIAEAAESAATGWDGLAIYLDGVTAMYFDTPWVVVSRARARRVASTNGRAEQDFRVVLERAWAEGSLRSDVDLTDLAFVTSALGGLARLPEPLRSVIVGRMRGILFDGLRAEGSPRPPLGGKPLDLEQFRGYLAEQVGETSGQ
ncbi:helix-turn-helix domain-containing protein [Microbacterium deminutum]|uniref:TetR/AcrR family transcriptional regulator n=1 Tax=Microbacterium deminutum TaxID=344164 RepID=A0ABP5BQV3_9MICO